MRSVMIFVLVLISRTNSRVNSRRKPLASVAAGGGSGLDGGALDEGRTLLRGGWWWRRRRGQSLTGKKTESRVRPVRRAVRRRRQ